MNEPFLKTGQTSVRRNPTGQTSVRRNPTGQTSVRRNPTVRSVRVIQPVRPLDVIQPVRRPLDVIQPVRRPLDVIQPVRRPLDVIQPVRRPLDVIQPLGFLQYFLPAPSTSTRTYPHVHGPIISYTDRSSCTRTIAYLNVGEDVTPTPPSLDSHCIRLNVLTTRVNLIRNIAINEMIIKSTTSPDDSLTYS